MVLRKSTKIAAVLVAALSLTGAGQAAAQSSAPSLPESSQPSIPTGSINPGGCTKNIVVAIPATLNTLPSFNENVPHGVASVQVGAKLSGDPDTQVITVPYDSTYPLLGISYRDSVMQGAEAAKATIARKAAECPGASFSLFGYSSGADSASYLASEIAAGRTAIAPERMTAAVLLSNPARNDAKNPSAKGGTAAGNNGIGLRDAYDYGQLSDRVLEFCNEGDLICDASNSNPQIREMTLDMIDAGFLDWAPLAGKRSNGALREAILETLNDPVKNQKAMQEVPSFARGGLVHMSYLLPGNGLDQGLEFIRARNI